MSSPEKPPVPAGDRSSRLASRLRPHDLEALRGVAWALPRELWLGIVGAPLLSGIVGAVVAVVNTSATMEYHGVAVGGLLTLAGIVPAVVAAGAAGRPVTRLAGGRLLLTGAAMYFVAAYTAVFAIALAFPLLALLGVWHFAQEPAGLGIGVFGLLCTTIWTPVLLILLASRVNPLRSTLLAVAQVVTEPAESHEDHRAGQLELVKDLRDLAINESGSGDRRAVQHRMAGLATIGLHADVEPADLALQELGVVTQHVLGDRDLALAGVRLVVAVVEGRADDDPDLAAEGADELIGLWRDAHSAGISPAVASAAVEGVARFALRCPDRGGDRALAKLLREMAAFARAGGTGLRADVALLEQLRPITTSASEDRAVTTPWADLMAALGPQGFGPLVQRLAGIADGKKPAAAKAARKPLVDAAVSLIVDHADGAVLPSAFRTSVRSLVGDGAACQLIEIADVVVDRDDISDDVRSALLGEVLSQVPQMRPLDLETLLEVLAGERAGNENLRLAPFLLPRLDDLVTRLVVGRNGRGIEATVVGPERYVDAVVTMITDLWISHVVTADEDSGESPVDALVARLLVLARQKKLTGRGLDTLRRRTGRQIQSLHRRSPERAQQEAEPLLPFLLSSWDEESMGWLVWWHREGSGELALPASDVPRLLQLRAGAEKKAAELLPIPSTDPFHGMTFDDALEAIDAGLRSLLQSDDEDVRAASWHTLRSWLAHTEDEQLKADRLRAVADLSGVAEDEILAGETFALMELDAFLLASGLLVGAEKMPDAVPTSADTVQLGTLLTPSLVALVEHCRPSERNVLRCAVTAWVLGVCAHELDPQPSLPLVIDLVTALPAARRSVARALRTTTTIPTALAVQVAPLVPRDVVTLFCLLTSQFTGTEGSSASSTELGAIHTLLIDSLRRDDMDRKGRPLRTLALDVIAARSVTRTPDEAQMVRALEDALRTWATTHLRNPESSSVFNVFRKNPRPRQGGNRVPQQRGTDVPVGSAS